MRTAPTPPERPKLRHGLAAAPHRDGNLVLHDPLGIGDAVVVSALAVEVAQWFDGELTVGEIAVAVKTQYPEARVSPEVVAGLAAALDAASLLDSPALRARFDGPVRKPSCLAPFADRPDELRRVLTRLFTAPGGPGRVPEVPRESPDSSLGRLRAVLAPHMDYGRGGVTYGHAFRELAENTDARVFVIVGTSHYSSARFTLSRQHFETPLGLAETDTEYVDRIAARYAPDGGGTESAGGLFEDPLAHVPEHSIELEVALLQFLLAGRRPFKIVPVLTGSIEDCVSARTVPREVDDIGRMARALRAAEAACPDPVCYIISGDLAHIGPKFGDKRKAVGPWLDESRIRDEAVLKALEAGCPGAFFDEVAAEQNARRVCGLSPAWLTLDVVRPKAGKVLHYQQYVHPQGKESVSFAAAAFYG